VEGKALLRACPGSSISGALSQADLPFNGMTVIASANGSWTGLVAQDLSVSSAPVTGVATFPLGASVSLTNENTNRTIKLTAGPFTMPTGVGTVGAEPPVTDDRTVSCLDEDQGCAAAIVVPSDGPAHLKLTVRLPRSDLRLVEVRGGGEYVFSGGHFEDGRSECLATLEAAHPTSQPSLVVLTFKASGRSLIPDDSSAAHVQ